MRINNYKKSNMASAISIALMPVLLSTSINVFAAQETEQEAKDNIESQVEVVEVVGVRSSLEAALLTKRNAKSIVDAISSKDIDSLPALDLGEALQAIPGVQVNREGERRSSEINLRGLPGGFIKTTANGQGFATPSRSTNPLGSSNPFGAFDAKVFDGVTVVKSPTANMQEGGIAGVVDKQLANALQKKDGDYRIILESRYEELNDSYDPGLAFSGTKHFIKDVFAGTFKFATSEQNFRRDSISHNAYATLDSALFPELNDWKAAQGIPAEDTVQYSRDNRQFTEYNEGTRTSFVGGLEWKASDELKFGADILYTQRDMDNSTLEILQIDTRKRGGVTITPIGDAFYGSTISTPNDDGSVSERGSWVVPNYEFGSARYTPGNRVFTFFEETQGIFLDAEWTRDNWTVDGTIAVSSATNEFIQTQFQSLFLRSGATGGVNGSINTGAGNIGDYSLVIDDWQSASNLDQEFSFGASPADDVNVRSTNGDNRTLFFAAGNHQTRERDDTAFEINANYITEIDFVKEVQFGFRTSSDELASERVDNSINGTNIQNLSNELWVAPEYTRSEEFFGGNAPGFARYEDGWLSLDVNAVQNALVGGGLDNPNNFPLTKSGLLPRTLADQTTIRGLDNNFDATTDINAIYAMIDFETEIGEVEVWGNAGVRYVETDLKATGYSRIDGVFTQVDAESDYSNTLPSVNVAFRLHEDVILRTAYSETMVRPNLAAFRPSSIINEGLFAVNINLPRSNLEAYTAKSYDLSLEWYNRDGSAVTFAIYQKDVKSFFDTTKLCPEDGGGLGYGPLELVDNGGGDATCFISTLFDDGEGNDPYQREINIVDIQNVDDTLTITGYELSVQQKLDFLPGFWKGFGGILNYSFVDLDAVDLNDDGIDDVNILPGVSETSYNVIAYWGNSKFNFRIAYNYRDDYMLSGGGSFVGSEDRFVKGRGQVDMSATYRATKNLSFNVRGFNLTEEKYEEYLGDNTRKARRTNWDGRTFQLSVSYKF